MLGFGEGVLPGCPVTPTVQTSSNGWSAVEDNLLATARSTVTYGTLKTPERERKNRGQLYRLLLYVKE